MPERFGIEVDGHRLSVEAGHSVAAALHNAGFAVTRRSVSAEARGPLCAMGICFECRVTIDGEPHRRACMETCRPGMRITTDAGASAETDEPARSLGPAAVHEADVAVVGGGPAGIAAACRAAELGAGVLLVDEGARPGGQIWRHRSTPPAGARRWLERLARSNARILSATSVVEILPGPAETDARAGEGRFAIHAVDADAGPVRIQARRVILATGARERFLPFPGWTLPGVFGVGGLQALLKSGASFAGQRVVLAGSGPLLLPVAAALADGGARLETVAEQAPLSRVARFAAGLWRQPAKLAEAIAYRLACVGTPFLHGAWVSAAEGDGGVRSVTLTDGRLSWSEGCDVLGVSFGLVPNLEAARLLGCALQGEAVAVDRWQATSVPGVFAAGEPTGIGGVERAIVEGEIAGVSAAGGKDGAERLARRRARLHAFSRALEQAFALRSELRELARGDTLVCRCEDVPHAALDPTWGARRAKLYARLGMGACQGRVCGSACAHLFGWTPDTARPPLLPAALGALCADDSRETAG